MGFFFLTINNFRILFAITAFLSIILTYITFKYFTESPRWLHSMGKRKECLEVFTFIAKVNGKEKEWNDFQKKNPKIINKIGEKQIESSDIKKNYTIMWFMVCIRNEFFWYFIKFRTYERKFFYEFNFIFFWGSNK